jgi:mannose-6-phosphate isomerase-like protein (cupin superfamily)
LHVINRNDAPPFTTADGSTIRELLAHRNSCIANQSLAEATLAPGQRTQAHFHPLCEEIYYILQGTGRMAVDADVREVSVGDAIAIPPGARHQILNTGEGDLVFLCCCAPAYEHADVVFVDPLIA